MIEDAREKWKARELKHMQEVLLEKKGLKKDDLERQREPILKLRQEAQRKKKRLQETLKMQEDIFEHTKNLFFPAGPPPEIKPILPPKEIERDLITVEDTILEQEVMVYKRKKLHIYIIWISLKLHEKKISRKYKVFQFSLYFYL